MTKWNFGKLGALREASLAIEEGLKFYYMDPETYDWYPLDDDFRRRLDTEKYVSPSSELSCGIQTEPPSEDHNSAASRRSAAKANPGSHDEQAKDDEDDETDIDGQFLTLFDADMPGALTLEEVKNAIDLSEIRILAGGQLRGWDRGDIGDATTVKGVIAELSAVVGPKIAKEMVVKLS
ncbi:MAG: hypothetical protein M1825_001145 [Sarcosagium campestre]|nr:MAG: hypothetical protein M1825_001145 [Sarcosagium campestre]